MEGTPYDILLTDFVMPRMTGGELAARARVLRPGLSIILATGYTETEIDPAMRVVRLAKPFDRAALQEGLLAALRQDVVGRQP